MLWIIRFVEFNFLSLYKRNEFLKIYSKMLSNIKHNNYLLIIQFIFLLSNFILQIVISKARQLISPALNLWKIYYNKNYYFLQRNHRPKNKKPIDSKCCQTKCCTLLWVQGYPYGLFQSLPTTTYFEEKNKQNRNNCFCNCNATSIFFLLALCVICVRTKIFFLY